MQLYLAWARTLGELVGDAELDWRDRYRAEFLVELLTAAAAPTNTLIGNPAALKHAWETAGMSLVRGTGHLLHDVVRNRGMPTTVDRSGFIVGETMAATPGAVVYRDDVCEMLQYAPSTPTIHRRPVLLIPPQIGRYYFMDLAPGRSFVEHAVAHGIPLFLVSWRNPTAAAGRLGLRHLRRRGRSRPRRCPRDLPLRRRQPAQPVRRRDPHRRPPQPSRRRRATRGSAARASA